ncbi:DUF6762 family protein [Clostridium oryzae]|uniref:Uncharacterized protein n=1 Tax=Clostridium oryzae TaxID=1450648 RepID=A0A1V4IG73_9CLOT|nr:DUF6762 family protein [Clostridium oryzae]OPJ58998.1 hypothetical protein CLORY_34880 [Clostridium oryzae]
MDFSSIVIMERDESSKQLTRELGSYEIEDGGEYISRAYCENNVIYIYFSTGRDVEDWEYTALCEEFDEDLFESSGYEVGFDEDEFNPTWIFKFQFSEDHNEVEGKICELCIKFKEEIERSLSYIEDKDNDYK